MRFYDLHLGDLPWCNISKTWSAFLGRNSSFPTFPDDVVWGIYNSHHYMAFAFQIFLTQARRLILKRWHIQCFSFVVSIIFCWFHPPPNKSRHCDAQTFTSTFNPQKTWLSRGELHHPFCHGVIALRNRGGGSGHSPVFVSWDFYGKNWKKKKKAFRALPVLVNTGYFEEHMKSARMHMFHVKLAILKHHTAHVRFGKW